MSWTGACGGGINWGCSWMGWGTCIVVGGGIGGSSCVRELVWTGGVCRGDVWIEAVWIGEAWMGEVCIEGAWIGDVWIVVG